MILIKKTYFKEFLKILSFLKKKKSKTFFIKIENNIIKICYSGEIEIVYEEKIDVTEKKSFCIEYEYVENIVKKLKNDFYVKIDLENKNVSIKEEEFLFNSNCISKRKQDYINNIEKKNKLVNKVNLDSKVFMECVNSNSILEKTFIVKKQGINLFFNKEKINCFSTDGFRAIFYKRNTNFTNRKCNFFLNKELILFINKVIKERKYNNFFLEEFKKFISINFCNLKIYSKENFRKKSSYKEIPKIGKEYKKIRLNNKSFSDSIKRIDICNIKKDSKIMFSIKEKKIKLTFSNENILVKDAIKIEKYYENNKGINILLNFGYIKDFLNINKSLYLYLFFSDNKSMVYMCSKDLSLLYCFMPIN
ncbi:DNA polymerase III beta subunit [Candidatus Vidania fulgoroideae]|nr:DNA polymerase III beta subunit [Candidatus Vidania fulgoroideae]